MKYYTGDIPAQPIVLDPARGEELIDLAPFTAADTEVTLQTFDGDLIDATFTVTFGVETVDIAWPTVSVLDTPGLVTLTVTLVGPTARERLAPVHIVVQGDDGWHNHDSARAEWPDASAVPDVQLFQLLECAKQQVLAYAPELPEGARPTLNYYLAQRMQARNLLNAAGAQAGEDGEFELRPFPLDWMVKQILRPHRGVPKVG